jgi:hypothetical protein
MSEKNELFPLLSSLSSVCLSPPQKEAEGVRRKKKEKKKKKTISTNERTAILLFSINPVRW